MRYKGLELYPFQAESIRSIEAGRSVIVSAPTGAGKTIIAEYAIDRALAQKRRIVYTSPIKALSNQKYRDLREEYGDQVGIMTGDLTVNPGASILIMTTEIFRNTIFEDSSRIADISYIVFDEVHYLGDGDRGSVWEESIIFAPKGIRIIALSATIGNLEEIQSWMETVRESRVDLVHTDDRPVPLHRFLYLEGSGIFDPRELRSRLKEAKDDSHRNKRNAPQDRRGGNRRGSNRQRARQNSRAPNMGGGKLVVELIKARKLPILYFAFSRKGCEALARRFSRRQLLKNSEEKAVLALFDDLIKKYEITDHPAIPSMRSSTQRGILYHHAGMLPVFKEIVERLFCSGFVKLLFTTETFALGVNMPARTVVFDSLSRWNGVEVAHLTPLEYRQMAGRAGRLGKDTEGEVYGVLDVRFDTARKVGDLIHKRPGAVKSQFNLGYSTIINLVDLMGNDIHLAIEKSLLAFQLGSPKQPLKAMRQRREVLEARGYIEPDNTITGKGRFCGRIHGFEIPLTELFWDGCFEGLDALSCAVLCASTVFEARRNAMPPALDMNPLPKKLRNRAQKRMREFAKAELAAGIEKTVRELDFGLASAIDAWANGESFSRLGRYTDLGEGDLVRCFRLTIQVLRQLAWALPKDNPTAEAANAAIALLNRDEVDAERQLNV